MTDKKSKALDYFETEYSSAGFKAQRCFPNEELCRFMGRNYFQIPIKERKKLKILEVGCGAGANLWMIAREGFNAIGIDLSPSAIELCNIMLKNYNCIADLQVGDMTNIDLHDETLDAIVDVFSSHCLDQKQGNQFLDEVVRLLKPGGKFFSYFPSTRSDSWNNQNGINQDHSNRLDYDTLNGLHRETGPYFGNDHPFRFLHPERYKKLLENAGIEINYCETLTRTYAQRTEIFEFVVIEGIKN